MEHPVGIIDIQANSSILPMRHGTPRSTGYHFSQDIAKP
jgi:hypothetical protein